MADKTSQGMDNEIPATPGWLIFVRYGQIAGSLILLVTAAVALASASQLDNLFIGWGPGFAIFAAIWDLLFLAAIILIPMFLRQFYFKWIILGLESFTVLWTLVAWAGLADWAVAFSIFDGTDDSADNDINTAHGASAAGAAFGAFLWISFIVTLVFYSIGCHQCRMKKKSWNTPSNVESMGPVGVPQTGPAYDPAPEPVGYSYQPPSAYPQTQYTSAGP